MRQSKECAPDGRGGRGLHVVPLMDWKQVLILAFLVPLYPICHRAAKSLRTLCLRHHHTVALL